MPNLLAILANGQVYFNTGFEESGLSISYLAITSLELKIQNSNRSRGGVSEGPRGFCTEGFRRGFGSGGRCDGL